MWIQKRLAVCGLLVSTCVFGSGCQTTDNSNAVGGAVVGTGLGALTGAIVGSAFGRRDAAAGALIGAAAGGVGGALIGHAQDQKNEANAKAAQAQYQQAQAAADQAALTNADIVYMVKSGLSAQVIVNSVRSRGGRFDMTPDAIVQLKANGVSDYLIQVMQTTPPPTVLPPGQVIYPAGTVVAEPAVGVYVAPRPYYGWGWRRW